MDQDIPGKYIHEKSPSHYLELKPDGSYFLFEGSAGVTGTYEVNGTEITILVGEASSRAKIQHDVITDSEGDQWIRTKSTKQASATEQASARYVKCSNCNSDVLETARFCSHCGNPVSAAGQVRHKSIQTKPHTPGTEGIAVDADPLESMTWLPAALRRPDFPWELIEAAGWFVALVILFMVAISKKP